MTPLSQWFSFRCDTLIGRIKTIIYEADDAPGLYVTLHDGLNNVDPEKKLDWAHNITSAIA